MELLAISLKCPGLREAIKKSEAYLKQGSLNIIAYVSARKLLEALENEEQQEWWKGVDLLVCEDTEVLKVMGKATQSRMRDTKENLFLREFLRILIRRREGVFLLADEEEGLNVLEQELMEEYSGLQVIGSDTTEHYTENEEGLINAINASAPKVILSRLAYPKGMRLMYEYRSYLNGSVWLMLPDNLIKTRKEGLKGRVSDLIYKTLLHKKIHQFVQEQEEK